MVARYLSPVLLAVRIRPPAPIYLIGGVLTLFRRFSALSVALAVVASAFVLPVHATVSDALNYSADAILQWMNPSNTQPLGGWNIVDFGSALFQSNKEQKYYTTPTESVEDSKGNVTNYYRGGDTTNTKIIDSYNRTFNTIHNTTNNTTNYSANVKLNDFLNSYTTNNNNYQFTADLKSWYYDNDTNNYNYTSNQTYYNTDNSKYYISIDNSTDEYYLVDVQYSPTFVTVNYTYNTTNNNVTNNYGDVTNVYYYELDDGRNSYSLTESEALGIATGYDVTNYILMPDDPDTLALLHFDDNYLDSSAYGRSFYSENRSSQFVDSGSFNHAVKLSSGSAAGVVINDLPVDSLQIDFRVYYDNISSLKVYLGDNVLLGSIPYYVYSAFSNLAYSDDGQECTWVNSYEPDTDYFKPDSVSPAWSNNFVQPAYNWRESSSSIYGAYTSVFSDNITTEIGLETKRVLVESSQSDGANYTGSGVKEHTANVEFRRSFNGESVKCTANFSNYVNQWVALRIVLSGGNLYYFVNGDLVGSGPFNAPVGDKVYIKSSGTIYLDELRVSTGSLVNSSSYTPAVEPFDTNMVLALPDELAPMTIYVRHQLPVNGWRIGGVRPSAPADGFFYLPLHSDYTGAQPLIYDGSQWVDVEAVVSPDGVVTHNVVGYLFTPDGSASDVNPDLQPGFSGDGSGGSGDSGDGSGGTGGGSDNDSTDDDSGILSELFSKLFGLIDTIIGSLLDGLISLATSVIERLTSLVDLFGSFGDSLSALWSWLPEEIVTVFVAGVTVVVFAAVIKVFI